MNVMSFFEMWKLWHLFVGSTVTNCRYP